MVDGASADVTGVRFLGGAENNRRNTVRPHCGKSVCRTEPRFDFRFFPDDVTVSRQSRFKDGAVFLQYPSGADLSGVQFVSRVRRSRVCQDLNFRIRSGVQPRTFDGFFDFL